jgi:hypothetical protein
MFIAVYFCLSNFFQKGLKILRIASNRRFTLNISYFLTIPQILDDIGLEVGLLGPTKEEKKEPAPQLR